MLTHIELSFDYLFYSTIVASWFPVYTDQLMVFIVVYLGVDVNNLKNGRKPVKLQKESPAGCAGEGKQSKENQEKWKGRFKD